MHRRVHGRWDDSSAFRHGGYSIAYSRCSEGEAAGGDRLFHRPRKKCSASRQDMAQTAVNADHLPRDPAVLGIQQPDHQ
jgi:hypothetical protein